jgi:hypothetical protein
VTLIRHPEAEGRRILAPLAVALLVACGRGASPTAPLPDGAKPPDAATVHAPDSGGGDPLSRLWTQAAGGEAGDLARLADREGASGLVERAQAEPSLLMTAVRAMAFAPEPGAFVGLPLLADVARGPDEAAAEAAIESAIDLAARPRRAIDPEDAAELKTGCDTLLALATDATGASGLHLAPAALRARRVGAIRALRMLADRGCVAAAAIPTDLDAH